MKRKWLCALLCLAATVMLFAVTASAETYGNLTYTVSNGEVTITGCKTFVGDALVIPAQINGYPVTSIWNRAFYNCRGLKSITVNAENPAYSSDAQGVLYNKDKTTLICCPGGKTECEIPSSVTSIGRYAFSGCSGLTSITVDAANPAYSNDAQGVLYNKDKTELICCPGGKTKCTIPSSVTSIGNSAFSGCSGLTSITIPSGVTSIGYSAFEGCSGLQKTVDNLIYIQTTDNPYFYLQDTTSTSTTSCEINANCKFIGYEAFSACSGLTSITIPSSVTSIGGFAFYGCSGLTSIEIPSSVTSIENRAFEYCSGLTSITIPSGVTSIGYSAFEGCSGLTSITVEAANPAYSNDVQGVLYNKDKTTLICCPGGKTECEIPSSVTSIGRYAFSGCSGLTSIEIPSGVTFIGECAFYGCNGLTSIEIPSSVTSIGGYAFYDCSGLTSITIWNADCLIADSSLTIPANSTIYGRADSTAQTYAQKNSRTFKIATCAHVWDDGVETTAPTCTEAGVAEYTCTRCGDVQYDDIPKVSALALSGVYTNGGGTLRFVTKATPTPADPEIEYFGTYIVPLTYFTENELTAGGEEQLGVGTVKYTQSIASGSSFAADLTSIPQAAYDAPIFAWSFVKFSGVETVFVETLGVFTVNGATLVKGGF